MPDSIARRRRGTVEPLAPSALTAASQLYSSVNVMASRSLSRPDASEDELWAFYDALGEFGAFVDWTKNAASRVRLGAAEVIPGADEPEILKEGDAAQLMEEFYGGPSGYAAFWQAMIPQLLVPGEGWIVAERYDRETPLLLANWSVQSVDSFKQQRAGSGVINKVQTAEGEWRELMPDSLPCRVWMPDPRRPWLARSPSRAALPTMRRIDLVDKRIVAELLSRVIMNGILWMPQEIQLPESPAYADQPDPFWAEFIDIGTRNISTPGSALAAFPYPVKVPGELIKLINHMNLAQPLDEQLLNERQAELSRLAKQLPLSAERQEGMAASNHWTGWLVNEDDVKISIAPICEIAFEALTRGYLYPLLAAAGKPIVGPNGGRLVVWGDYSELTSPPDKQAGTLAAYDRGEASGAALRRESGLDESDKPDQAEQTDMIWLKAARDGSSPVQPIAIEELTGVPLPVAPTPAAPAVVGPTPDPVSVEPPSAAGPPTSSSPDESPLPMTASSVDRRFAEIARRVNGRA